MRSTIETHCQGVIDALQHLPYDTLDQVATLLADCHQQGGTVFILGNGGSAATASHFACDLTKGTRHADLPRFRVAPLTDNVPLMTAWGNDNDYREIFAQQLLPLVRPGDVVVAISASGNSPNVLEAIRTATELGASTVAWTGRTGGAVAALADITVRVPADTMEQVEDGHMIIAHAVCVALRGHLHARAAAPA